MHKLLNSSPVVGYKIALVNNANLHAEYVEEPSFMEGVPGKRIKQWEQASVRQLRAIRKARLIAQENRSAMLFGERKDGTHFPISFRQKKA